jgi:non-ribosomal peptide synthetase component F
VKGYSQVGEKLQKKEGASLIFSQEKLILWRKYFGDHPKIFNTYGPTEATVISTFIELSADVPREIPIGKPIMNSRVYIMDQGLQLLPIGEIGELYIGGAGVARGYLNHLSLTNEKFIPSPFQLGDRLYKTGDLARFNSSGDIEFVGR